jgi:hypothetical protein
MISDSRSKMWGLLTRRERWGLSARGLTAMLLLAAVLFVTIFFGIYPFFSVTKRVNTRVLVVEGWIDPHAIRGAVEEFRTGGYEKVFTTGGPVRGMGQYTNDYNTAASVSADRLRKEGLPAERVQMVPSRVSARDRTYSSALALRRWCEENHVAIDGINVLTENVHARRTRLLFDKAFGGTVKVGIIAIPPADYDPRRWWRYSEGVREVLGESIAYIYARVFFWPASAA